MGALAAVTEFNADALQFWVVRQRDGQALNLPTATAGHAYKDKFDCHQ